jgi:hypothetical protein
MQSFKKRFWWLFWMKKPIEQPDPQRRPLRQIVEEMDYKLDELVKQQEEQARKPGIILVAPGAFLDSDTSDVEPFEPFDNAEGEAPGE